MELHTINGYETNSYLYDYKPVEEIVETVEKIDEVPENIVETLLVENTPPTVAEVLKEIEEVPENVPSFAHEDTKKSYVEVEVEATPQTTGKVVDTKVTSISNTPSRKPDPNPSGFINNLSITINSIIGRLFGWLR